MAGSRSKEASRGGGESGAKDARAAATAAPSAAGAPTISLPTGGGAIRSIGETFAANPANGTGTMAVPIAISKGRGGFEPKLSLSYDSGAGNGPFGFGWSLSLPQIARKTDKGLPRYQDHEESDVFVLSGAEDLVPVLEPGGDRFLDTTSAPGYRIERYRPRIEGSFARIERWTRVLDGDVHWRSLSHDNILTRYGGDASSRIADPEDPTRIFAWLLCESRDDKGNGILYEYLAEDGAGVDLGAAHQRNRGDRGDARRASNRYLKRIHYGNRGTLLDPDGRRPRQLSPAQLAAADWMFEVVFDYGEHDEAAPRPDDPGAWLHRADAFSSYRAGFEVRTARLCRRVLMFHHFADEPDVGAGCLVTSLDLGYSHEAPPENGAAATIYTFLRTLTQRGYVRQGAGYARRALPAVTFEYSRPVVQDRVELVDGHDVENLPAGLSGAHQWTDLHGEGIPGVLTRQGESWFYKRNRSALRERTVELAPLERVPLQPGLAMAGGSAQLMDLGGDGVPALVALAGPTPGFQAHDDREGWLPFAAFASRLNRDPADPNLRLVDLDGDGRADVLISEQDAFVWHPSLGQRGFGPAQRVPHPLDEERGPRLVFGDGSQTIYLADLSGDGLTDLVRIRNGEICYWPNLGHGRFGAKITMDAAPRFDRPDQFEPQRLRLADVDGSGTADLIYLHREGVRIYENQAGNGWSAPRILDGVSCADDVVGVATVDLFGNGTTCLVWSSSLPGEAGRPLRYVDLMGGRKPHLLVRYKNQLGAETQVDYVTSTRFYLRDQQAGVPWVTRLPFPVHVVERVQTIDRISGHRFTTRYAYHHGAYDGHERELRGFGMVEQWDTEEFGAIVGQDGEAPADNLAAAFHVPPVLTRTWFHTGSFPGRERISGTFAGHLLPETIVPAGLSLQEEREACRALKGRMLRQESYALDGSAREGIPYTVTEQNFTIACLQRRPVGARHAVFLAHRREAVTSHHERRADDPRVQHALTLEVDPFGNVLKELGIAYGRRISSPDPAMTAEDRARQARALLTFSARRFTAALSEPELHRTPLPAEVRTYELTGLHPEGGAARFGFDEWTRDGFALLASTTELGYEQQADGVTAQRRLWSTRARCIAAMI